MYHCKGRQHGRCRLADGAQALAEPVRLKQYFSHTKEVPEKPPFTDDVSILKRWDNCNVEQKVAPLNPPESGILHSIFFGRGLWGGAPRQGGRETFCVPTVLSCDLRGRHLFYERCIFSAKRHLAA